MNALAHRYFMVKLSQTDLAGMTEWAVVAIYSKYRSSADWVSIEAYEYAYSVYLAATASALNESACNTCRLDADCPFNWTAQYQENCEFWEDAGQDESDQEIDAECAHRLMNGFSTRCFCGNHSDVQEVLYA